MFEKNASGIIPTSTFDMMMSKYNKEKQGIEDEIKELVRQQQKELISPKNEYNANRFVALLNEINESNVLTSGILQKVIKKIIISTYFLTIRKSFFSKENTIISHLQHFQVLYSLCDDLIKGFMTYEEHNSNLC